MKAILFQIELVFSIYRAMVQLYDGGWRVGDTAPRGDRDLEARVVSE